MGEAAIDFDQAETILDGILAGSRRRFVAVVEQGRKP